MDEGEWGVIVGGHDGKTVCAFKTPAYAEFPVTGAIEIHRISANRDQLLFAIPAGGWRYARTVFNGELIDVVAENREVP